MGRRVRIGDADGERLCFLSGQRAVIGDRVRWTDAPGEGGKLMAVEPRTNELTRSDPKGHHEVLAANLGGLLVVVTPTDPPFHAPLLDRYIVGAGRANLPVAALLAKIDLPVPDGVAHALDARAKTGLPVLRCSARTGEGLDEVRAFLAEHDEGPWALVGYSGVGKTSLVGALLPEQDVGPVGAISEYWGTGRHTTSRSRLFVLPGGGEVADSPGIRGFIPAIDDPEAVRDHYPGMHALPCKYRDCLHRPDEAGCVAEATVEPELLAGYRELFQQVEAIHRRRGPGR